MYPVIYDMVTNGSHNLIMKNGFNCPEAVIVSDPQLQSLQWNSPGNTPTMAIPLTSPAIDAGDDPSNSPDKDQRGVDRRPQGGGIDIGAFEARTAKTRGRPPGTHPIKPRALP